MALSTEQRDTLPTRKQSFYFGHYQWVGLPLRSATR
jgi:hypothetical protein